MTQFLDMGGYAPFVWSAYGVTVLGLGAAIIITLRAYARAKAMFVKLPDRKPQ
ncbi:MAG TPA: heme exporter protein CcmD [Rhizomicrobium sp.]|jgi:heme exporter protein CcmD